MATAEELRAALGKAVAEVCGRYGNTRPHTSSGKLIYGSSLLRLEIPEQKQVCEVTVPIGSTRRHSLAQGLGVWPPAPRGALLEEPLVPRRRARRAKSRAVLDEDMARRGHLRCPHLQAHLQWLQNPVSTRQDPMKLSFRPVCLPACLWAT